MRVQTLFLWLFVLWISGCATTPRVGVRPKFDDTLIHSVTVLPVYSVAGFGLSPNEVAHLTKVYEAALLEWVQHRGLAVVGPEEFRTAMTVEERQTLRDGFPPATSLEKAFEPREEAFLGAEVRTLRTLYEAGAIPTEAILVGEVVYQTEGHCAEPATSHNERAWVDQSNATDSCVVSHFQAKLVHAPTGETIWHNRTLLERRAAVGPATRLQTIHEVVVMTLEGPGGISGVIAIPSAATQASHQP